MSFVYLSWLNSHRTSPKIHSFHHFETLDQFPLGSVSFHKEKISSNVTCVTSIYTNNHFGSHNEDKTYRKSVSVGFLCFCDRPSLGRPLYHSLLFPPHSPTIQYETEARLRLKITLTYWSRPCCVWAVHALTDFT